MNQSDVVEAFNPDFSRKHGCAWFVWGDSKLREPEKTGGWASIGGEPAFKFNRPRDLPKDITWWTNLNKSEAWSLGQWSHIKHADFLGPSWLSLMSEWGFPQKKDELKINCAAWSEVLARLAEFLSRWSASLTSNTDLPHPTWSWGDGDFHEAVASKLGWTHPKANNHPALELAYVDEVEQELPSHSLNNNRKISLSLPRTSHAKKILSTPFPSNDFKEVMPDVWPDTAEKRWEWIEKQTLPLLIRFDDVTFRSGYEKEAALWWGLRGRRFASASLESVWLTAEDALYMRQWIDTMPSIALMASSWERFPMDLVSNWPSLDMGFLHDNSIVTGLLHESLWRAASTPVRTPTKRIKSEITPQSIWMRATDLRICFEEALLFQNHGFTILSYGQGSVTLLFNSSETFVNHWVDALSGASVCVPSMLAAHAKKDPDVNFKSVNLWLKSQQSIEPLLWLDRLLWPWIGPKKQELKPILEYALRSLASLPPPKMANENWSQVFKDELQSRSRDALRNVFAKT